MALHKPKFREIVFYLIYAQDFVENEERDLIHFLTRHFKVPKKTISEVYSKAQKIREHLGEIDPKIDPKNRQK